MSGTQYDSSGVKSCFQWDPTESTPPQGLKEKLTDEKKINADYKIKMQQMQAQIDGMKFSLSKKDEELQKVKAELQESKKLIQTLDNTKKTKVIMLSDKKSPTHNIQRSIKPPMPTSCSLDKVKLQKSLQKKEEKLKQANKLKNGIILKNARNENAKLLEKLDKKEEYIIQLENEIHETTEKFERKLELAKKNIENCQKIIKNENVDLHKARHEKEECLKKCIELQNNVKNLKTVGDKNAKLQEELHKKEQCVEKLQKEVHEREKNNQQLNEENKKIKCKNSSLQGENEKLQHEIHIKNNEILRLNDLQKAFLLNPTDVEKTIDMLEKDNAKLQEQNLENQKLFTHKNKDIEHLKAKHKDLNEKIENLKQEKEEQKKAFGEERMRAWIELYVVKKELYERRNRSKISILSSQSSSEITTDYLRSTASFANKYFGKDVTLEEQKALFKKVLNNYLHSSEYKNRDMYEDHSDEMSQLNTKNENLETENQQLRHDNENSRIALTNLQHDYEVSIRVNRTLENKYDQINTEYHQLLLKENANSKNISDQKIAITNLKNQLENLKATNESLIKELNQLKQRLYVENGNIETENLKEKITSLNKIIEELQIQNKTLTRGKTTVNINESNLKGEKNQLEEQIEILHQEKHKIEKKLEACCQKINELDNKNQQLTDDKRLQKEQFQNKLSQVKAKSESERKTLNDQHVEVLQQYQREQQKLEKVCNDKDQQIRELTFKLEGEIESNIEGEICQANQEIQTLKRDKYQLKEHIKTLNQEKCHQKDQIKILSKEKSEIKEQLENVHKEIGALQIKNNKIDENMQLQKEQFQHELNTVKTKLETEKETLSSQHSELLQQYQQANNDLKREADSIFGEKQKLEKACNEKDQQIRELATKLAREMSNKISANEQALENVSVLNRPMNIATDYEMLCSNQWHDAKCKLDDICQGLDEGVKVNFLTLILKEASAKAKIYERETMVRIQEVLCNPLHDGSYQSTDARGDSKSMPLSKMADTLKVAIGDYLRVNVEHAQVEQAVQDVKQIVASSQDFHMSNIPRSVFESEIVNEYIMACILLAWKMIIQRPPMLFKEEGVGERWRGENYQDVSWNSSDPNSSQSRVKYYVHPALHHGNSLMVKGRVYLSKQ